MGHRLWWGVWQGQWGDGFYPGDPNFSESVPTLMGLVTPSCLPAHSQVVERRSLANWYELWPSVIIFLRNSEVAKQFKGLL